MSEQKSVLMLEIGDIEVTMQMYKDEGKGPADYTEGHLDWLVPRLDKALDLSSYFFDHFDSTDGGWHLDSHVSPWKKIGNRRSNEPISVSEMLRALGITLKGLFDLQGVRRRVGTSDGEHNDIIVGANEIQFYVTPVDSYDFGDEYARGITDEMIEDIFESSDYSLEDISGVNTNNSYEIVCHVYNKQGDFVDLDLFRHWLADKLASVFETPIVLEKEL